MASNKTYIEILYRDTDNLNTVSLFLACQIAFLVLKENKQGLQFKQGF